MNCELVQIGKRTDGRYEYRCTLCGRSYASRYDDPARVHRNCSTPDAEAQEVYLACIHRGEPTGDAMQCETCGRRDQQEPVHACALHDRCVMRKWTADLRKLRASGLAICLICRDRTLPDGSRPWDEIPSPTSQ